MQDVLIYDCVRTPRGRARAGGGLYEVAPHRLVADLLTAVTDRLSLDPTQVADLILGCVTPIGDQGYNIAQASLMAAKWPDSVAGAQVNRYCASGLESIHSAAARIAAGWDDLIVAGGVESMSRVPLGSDGGPLLDNPSLMLETSAIPQGISADLIASLQSFTREELDTFALQSQQRAENARKKELFKKSIVVIKDENGIVMLDADEHPRPTSTLEALGGLSPAFAKTGDLGFDALALRKYPALAKIDHRHTAGNSSGLVDGAGLVVLGNEAMGKQLGLKPRARIRAIGVASSDPTIMLTGMIPATEKVLAKAELTISDIDLIEVNEAFAAVPLAFMKHFGLKDTNVNVNGGSIALGHPVGATGAMLVGTIVDVLEQRKKKLGLVTLCAGGGQGIAAVIELI
ncbi:MAG: acetyl-CoA C-acetyltransferase [Saprospiraceae bacterium]